MAGGLGIPDGAGALLVAIVEELGRYRQGLGAVSSNPGGVIHDDVLPAAGAAASSTAMIRASDTCIRSDFSVAYWVES